MHRQVVRRVAPGVLVLVAVLVNDIEKAEDNGHYRYTVHIKGTACQFAPAGIAALFGLLARGHKISIGGYDGRYKSDNHTGMAKVSDQRINHLDKLES